MTDITKIVENAGPQTTKHGADRWPSVYQTHRRADVLADLHFVEWFSGATLPSYWSILEKAGSNTSGMSDEVDGGYFITTGTAGSSRRYIYFNNIDPFSNLNSVTDMVIRCTSNIESNMSSGLMSDPSAAENRNEIKMRQDVNFGIFFNLTTGSGSTETTTASAITADTIAHHFALIQTPSAAFLRADGQFAVTKTNNLSDTKMQPFFSMQKRTSNPGGKTGHITFLEAFNT